MTSPFWSDDQPLLDALCARSPSDSLPLLLEVARRQAAKRRPADLLAHQRRDGFVAPSILDLRTAHALDALALDVARDFEAVLLSPLAPLGCCAAVSPTNQDRAVTTIRGTEVVSDPTNVMALLCAERLKADPSRVVRLCTLHQVVRAQRFPPRRGFSQHFRMFAAAEAGPALADHGFEVRALVAHAALHLQIFDEAERRGYRLPDRRATLFVGERARPVADRVRARLAEELPSLPVEEAPLASSYYDGLRLLISVPAPSGERAPLADVGLFDWMQKLTSNARMRFVASGLGIQLFPLLFGGRQ
jgi:hypothetical protein